MQSSATLSDQQYARLYEAFNRREIETVLAFLQPDVQWANGMEGGFVYGRDAVRQYWRHQFTLIRSHVEPLQITRSAQGPDIVTVHQVVHDPHGQLLQDKTVQHMFTVDNGLVRLFEIGASDPAS